MKMTGKPALILIDIQKGFDRIDYWGEERNNPDAEIYAGKLLETWRLEGLPVFHVKHCSQKRSSLLHELNEGNEFKDVVKPLATEPVIKKGVNSAFMGTGLCEQLRESGISTIVIAGLTTDHCISTTARMGANYGFNVWIVADATATFNRKGINGQNYSAAMVHDMALASLNNEFASVVWTDDLINRSITAVHDGTQNQLI